METKTMAIRITTADYKKLSKEEKAEYKAFTKLPRVDEDKDDTIVELETYKVMVKQYRVILIAMKEDEAAQS